MKIRFDTPARKWTIFAVAFVLSFAYIAFAGIQLVAAFLAERPSLRSLQVATRLDWGNAEYRYHLGRYYDLIARDTNSALREYKSAVQLNPHSARYWFDLAGAYQVLGDVANQTIALEHAIQADPTTPDAAWEASNLYLSQGENDKALREFRVVLANYPPLAEGALKLCWRVEPDVDALLRDVIPHQSDSYVTFLSFLESQQETSGTMKVWDALTQNPQPFPPQVSYDYIQYLIQHKEVDEAVLVWKETAARFGLSEYLASANNLVVNGSFNLKVLNAGFDWQYHKQSSVGLTLDPSEFHGGRRSLLITFDGPGISEAGILQLIPVQPSTSYEFTAYYKNSDMEGAGGPHFTIQDVYSQAVYYESEELKDSGFWKSVSGDFTTAPDCKVIVLHIRRLPAGSPMRGKLWVDDFHLVRKDSQPPARN
jgi:tetratricopeptide (TPR) repeat protein